MVSSQTKNKYTDLWCENICSNGVENWQCMEHSCNIYAKRICGIFVIFQFVSRSPKDTLLGQNILLLRLSDNHISPLIYDMLGNRQSSYGTNWPLKKSEDPDTWREQIENHCIHIIDCNVMSQVLRSYLIKMNYFIQKLFNQRLNAIFVVKSL